MYIQAIGNCQGAWAGNMPILSSEDGLPVRPAFPHRATTQFGLLNVPIQSLKHSVPGHG
jgi:hypothetical protein